MKDDSPIGTDAFLKEASLNPDVEVMCDSLKIQLTDVGLGQTIFFTFCKDGVPMIHWSSAFTPGQMVEVKGLNASFKHNDAESKKEA